MQNLADKRSYLLIAFTHNIWSDASTERQSVIACQGSRLVLDPWSLGRMRTYTHTHTTSGIRVCYWSWMVSVDFDELAVGYDANAQPLYNVHLRISAYRLCGHAKLHSKRLRYPCSSGQRVRTTRYLVPNITHVVGSYVLKETVSRRTSTTN